MSDLFIYDGADSQSTTCGNSTSTAGAGFAAGASVKRGPRTTTARGVQSSTT